MANLAAAHEAKRDVLSALVTHEWLANEPTFRGWGFPHAHNARARCVATRATTKRGTPLGSRSPRRRGGPWARIRASRER